jgi:hypothetical protein
MTEALRKSCLLYNVLLFAYPRDFRQRFGSEMLTTFSEQMCSEWKRSGLVGIFQVWRSALWELLSVAVPLQLRSSIVVAMALSCLWSSALFLALFRAVSPTCGK